MDRAIGELQRAYLSDEEIASSRLSMGLDTQLIADGTYVVVEDGGSHRRVRRVELARDARMAATTIRRCATPRRSTRRRTRRGSGRCTPIPTYVRRGIGRMVLAANEAAARAAGFTRAELMATLAGEPLYLACGYEPIERVAKMSEGGVPVPGSGWARC